MHIIKYDLVMKVQIIQTVMSSILQLIIKMQLSFNNEISTTTQPILRFFVQNSQSDKITFPLIPNTYTLWRNYAFQNIKQLQSYKKSPRNAIYEFYLISEANYLKKFTEKILKSIENTVEKGNIGPNIPQEYKIGNGLVQKYYKALYQHSLYAELFQDIIKIPYLSDAFPVTKKYKLSDKYRPRVVDFEQKQGGNSFSDGILSKGVGFITSQVFNKTFLFRVSSLAFRINPIAMVASFAYAEYVSHSRKQKKGVQLSQKLSEVLQDIEQKVEVLRNLYEECVGLLGNGLKNGGSDKQRAILAIKQVMVEDWLQIETYKDEQGWQVVVLKNLKSPQAQDKPKQFEI